MKPNYDKQLEEIIKTLKPHQTPSLLLHSCCAPCSTTVLERLSPYFKITVFYYNPNIDPLEEYEKRKQEEIRFIHEFQTVNPVSFLDCDHDQQSFLEIAKGLENAPERGARCLKCYRLRLTKTAEMAKAKQFDYFATTLTLSPYKNCDQINEIAFQIEKEKGISYLPSDFKKQNGYLRSIQLSKEYQLYRQDFCGCQFSKQKKQ